MAEILKFGIPKGSLEEATVDLFKQAGWTVKTSSRSYFPGIDDEEMKCSLIRPQEMGTLCRARHHRRRHRRPRLGARERFGGGRGLRDGLFQGLAPAGALGAGGGAGLAGAKPEDLAGGTISTELVGFTQRYFAERNIPVTVEFSWGATEAKVVEGLCDAIVEVTETGSTIKANNLRIVCDLMESVPVMIANQAAWGDPLETGENRADRYPAAIGPARRGDGRAEAECPGRPHRGDHRRSAESEKPDGGAPVQVGLGIDREHPAGEGSAADYSRAAASRCAGDCRISFEQDHLSFPSSKTIKPPSGLPGGGFVLL